MSYQVLARKYRPQRFADVIGQEHVTRTLMNAIAQQRIAHGYIFSGHRGIGKTTVARILAMALNCRGVDGKADKPQPEPCGKCDSCVEIRNGNSVDVIEIDAATNRGIDEIRELRDAARYRPARDRFKIWILDEAHQITDAAFNALLKTLEEPPGHVVFMLATTQPEDIPQTIRSRCQHFSFHAVRFDDIVGQLRDIAKKEKITADDNALAVLAEAGDGSMRDALSIMDQAIACCGTTLTSELVRGLVGSVPSETLEQMLGAVARNASEDVLRMVDKLVTEGQSPAHFARQMARFLRNATVAKVAGSDSPLLQISQDERARVGRVAEQFSEEDLARHLQIMLRTYDDIGYRQEQRFHLELGLLKMVHAQRLLPLEQLLSGEVASAPAPARGAASPAAPAPSRSASPAAPTTRTAEPAAPPRVSPFEADRARKTTPRSETAASPSAAAAVGTAVAIEEPPTPEAQASGSGSLADIQRGVLTDLEVGGHRMLAALLNDGEWSVAESEVLIKLAAAPAAIKMAVTAEAQRILNAAASKASGRNMKVRAESSNQVQPNAGVAPAPSNGGPSARARAAEDPIVRRMQEKFSAEIRTVIDHRQKH